MGFRHRHHSTVLLGLVAGGIGIAISLYVRLADQVTERTGPLSTVGHIKVFAVALLVAGAGVLASAFGVVLLIWLCMGLANFLQWLRNHRR